MFVLQRGDAVPFTTKDGSTIRSLLDLSVAPVQNQSLAEATIPPGARTQPHYHAKTEEFYYVIQGSGLMKIGDETRRVNVGDAILIPAGAIHTLLNDAPDDLKILCCCAPPYSHDDTFLI